MLLYLNTPSMTEDTSVATDVGCSAVVGVGTTEAVVEAISFLTGSSQFPLVVKSAK